MTWVRTLKHHRILLLAGLPWLACLVVGASVASAATPPGTVPNLASPTHPLPSAWYSSANPTFTWTAATASSSPIAGYSFVLDKNPATVPGTAGGTSANSFAAQVPYGVGSGPAEDRVADLSSNGILDIIAENSSSNSVSVLMGNGDGTFKPAVNYATAGDPWSMDIGDVNGDGKIDIVTCNNTANSVSVLMGNGDGTFQPAVNYSTGTSTAPECVRLGDVNGDGKLDIITANAGNNDISVLLNNGNGIFGAPTTFDTDTHPTSIAVGDMNGDGRLDIVTANYATNDVSVLMGSGNGTFQSAVNYACGNEPETVVNADLNGDGKPDIATVNYVGTASVLLNKGDGTFATHVDYTTGAGPYDVGVADLNQDGVPDLVTTNHNANTVSILYGNGNGTFQGKVDLATGPGPFWVALGDFSSSGYGDLAVTNETNGTVSVLLGSEYFRSASSALTAAFTGKADGVWYFHVCAVDSNGVGGQPAMIPVHIDTVPPITAQSGADGNWHNSAVPVTFARTDVTSGVAFTQYSVDGGAWTTGSSVIIPAPAGGSNDGLHTIQYRSTDNAGNVETAKGCTVKIDTTAPATSQSGADGAWHSVPVTVSLSSSDGTGSGVVTTQYSTDGGNNWTTGTSVTFLAPLDGSDDGSHIVLYRSTDAAGNQETAKSCTVNIDAAPPTTSVVGADSAWHDAPVTLTFTGSDAGSGVASTQYSTDNGATWTTGDSVQIPAPSDGSGDGPHTVLYCSTDKFGHAETPKSCTVNIDTTAPTTTQSGADMAWHSSDVTVTFKGSDAGSGVASTQYSVDGGAWQTGASVTVPAPADGSNDGVHTVDYQSTDKAGNVGAVQGCVVKIDTNGPVTVDNAAAVWHEVPFTLQLTATNKSTAATTTQYSLSDDQHWQTGSAIEFSGWKRGGGSGLYTVYYRSTDAAGVVEAEQHCTVMLDATRPVTTDDAPSGPQATSVTVHLSATDTFSGVDQTWYQVDGGQWLQGTSVMIPALADHANDGVHTINYFSVDKAGNSEAGYRTCKVVIATP